MIRHTHSTHKLKGFSILIGIVLAGFAPVTVAGKTGASIRLHDEAGIDSDEIRIRDVAEFDGDYARFLEDVVIATLGPDDQGVTVTLGQLRDAATQHDANWGRLSLGGYASCRVYRISPQPQAISAPEAPLVSNPMEEVGLESALTLQDRVMALIEQFAGVERSELKISFSDHDEKTLAQSAYQDRYEFEPLASVPLGRVPIVIRRYRDNRLIETYRVVADVSRRYMAVVAKNTIGRHQVFTPSDIEIREVYIGHAGHPITDLARVIGQRSASVLRTDAVVFDQYLQSPLMVRRGELITVRCISGGLVIKTIGRATEDGALDQVIQVRRDRSRRVYPVRVTGRQEGITLSADLDSPSMGAQAARPVDRSQP